MKRDVSPSRAGRYLTRIEAHLPSLANDAARRDFLSREISKWEDRYARFMETEGDSHRSGDEAGQPTAFDFSETIIALGAAMARYAQKAAA